ncbi:MAG: allantoinase AllB [Gemmatimonadetes bacterium]|nr:allantoinase AllB [Gemmatimonadota bacterium]
MTSFLLRARRIVTPGSPPRAGTIVVENGRIAELAPPGEPARGRREVDAGDAVVLPGLVDTHVHINEPGRTDWEGFATATRAAAAGGVTTLLDMPLNSIPATTSVTALEAKRAAAAGQCAVDVGFLGGVVPGNTGDLRPLWDAGVFAFKCFMVPSGVAEFGHVTEPDLRAAVPLLAGLGATLMVHAESPAQLGAAPPMTDPRSYAQYLATRPTAAEHEAIALVLRLSHEFGARVHIVHVASSDAIPLLAAARATDTPVSVETCPHYLHFAAEGIADGATDHKCAPPVREARHRDALWRALLGGSVQMVVSDHSPCPPALKRLDTGSFAEAWGGIASLQHGLAIVWNGARARGAPVERLAGWMSEQPARLAGLWGRKGAIAPGFDADLVLWNPDGEHTVAAGDLLQRHPVSPYVGATLPGVVEATYLRGSLIYGEGRIMGEPRGELLRRG